MRKSLLLFIYVVISYHSVAKAPIYCNGKIFNIKSINKEFSLRVIAESKINPKFAIVEVTKRGNNTPLYIFKTDYGSRIDYIVSETGETVLQIVSFTRRNSNNSKGSSTSFPYSKIKVFQNGKLKDTFELDFVFCTFSSKNKYQNEITNIDETKYLNFIKDTLYVISENVIYGININDGKAIPATSHVELKPYKFKWRKLRNRHLRKYEKYNELLNNEKIIEKN